MPSLLEQYRTVEGLRHFKTPPITSELSRRYDNCATVRIFEVDGSLSFDLRGLDRKTGYDSGTILRFRIELDNEGHFRGFSGDAGEHAQAYYANPEGLYYMHYDKSWEPHIARRGRIEQKKGPVWIYTLGGVERLGIPEDTYPPLVDIFATAWRLLDSEKRLTGEQLVRQPFVPADHRPNFITGLFWQPPG